MATQQVQEDDFSTTVERVRRAAAAAGELRAPAVGRYVSPLGEEERAVVLRLLRDGTYASVVADIGEGDPDVADE